jgi:SAM-dependent methyltransferase
MPYKTDHTDSSFLSIIETWPDYYKSMDEGLGTTYERFILHKYFELIDRTAGINSVLEAPSFGMTGISGINSLWWSKRGKQTVIVDTDKDRIQKSADVWKQIPLNSQFQYVENIYKLPFSGQEFDMSWNFASIWFVEDLQKFAEELSRVTKKVIFICVPNRFGIGFILRKIFADSPLKSIHLQNIKAVNLKRSFGSAGYRLVQSGYLDIPPWPDIAMKKEDMLKKIGLGSLVKESADERSFEKKCIVNYFSGKNPDLENEIMKYSFLENVPFPIKQIWGHHRFFIFFRK